MDTPRTGQRKRWEQFSHLLLLAFLGGLLAIPNPTAHRAMRPELAQPAGLRLERLNAAFEGISYLAVLLGPALAGLLVVQLGAANVLRVDAATFGISALLIAALLPVAPAAPMAGRGATTTSWPRACASSATTVCCSPWPSR